MDSELRLVALMVMTASPNMGDFPASPLGYILGKIRRWQAGRIRLATMSDLFAIAPFF